MSRTANTRAGRIWRRALGSLGSSHGFARQVSTLTLSNVLVALITIAQGVVVARILGPSRYGTAVLIMAFPGVLFAVMDARTRDAIIKYLSAFDKEGDGVRARAVVRLGYSVDLVIATLTIAIIAVLAHWGSRVIVKTPGYEALMVVYSASYLLFALEGTSSSVLSVARRFSTLAWITVASALFRSALIVGLVVAGYGVVGVVLGNAAGLAAVGAASALAAHADYRRWGSGGRRWWHELAGYRREIARFLAYNDLSGLFGVATKQLDVVILGYYRGSTAVGWYRLAKSIVGGIGYLQRPLQSVVFPRIARLQDLESAADRRALLARLATWVSVPLAGLCFVGVWLIPPAVRILVGEAYAPSILAAQLLFVAGSLGLASFWVRPLYLSTNGEKAWAAATGGAAVLFLLLAFPGVVLWGHTGLAAASAISGSVTAVALVLGARARLGAPPARSRFTPTLAPLGAAGSE